MSRGWLTHTGWHIRAPGLQAWRHPASGTGGSTSCRLEHERRFGPNRGARRGPCPRGVPARPGTPRGAHAPLRLDTLVGMLVRLSGRVHLNQVSACVVEHGRRDRAHLCRSLCERDTKGCEALVLPLNVVDGKGGEGNPVIDKRSLEWFRSRVLVGLKY